MKKVLSVVGARPNFMKIAPIAKEFKNYPNIEHLIVHTGQHYDSKMSDAFFEDLDIPAPNFFLGIGSGSHAVQTANIILKFEQVLLEVKPDIVLVVGDVNSTIACSITAVKMGIKVAHIEAGLRSNDLQMPEEINRIVTDSISSYFFITEKSGLNNLLQENKAKDALFLVGNTMIDTLVQHFDIAKNISSAKIIKQSLINKNYELPSDFNNFILTTLHRPSNVDNKEQLSMLFEVISFLSQTDSKNYKFVIPIHPRTYKNLLNFKILENLGIDRNPNIILIEPLSYVKFLNLMMNSRFVLTDSGGIQEETTYLKKLCITLRTTTERPITTEIGSNYLLIPEKENILDFFMNKIDKLTLKYQTPEFWDGFASQRICQIINSKI